MLPSRLLRRGFWRRLLTRLPLRFAVLRFSEVSAADAAWVSLPPKMRLSQALKLSHQEVFFSGGGSRGGAGVAHAFDGGFGAGGFGFFAAERFGGFVFFRLGDALVARFAVFFYVVGADAVDFVVRVFEVDVRNQDDVDIQTLFHRKQLGAFFVQQEGGDIDGHLGAHFSGVVLHRFFLNDA